MDNEVCLYPVEINGSQDYTSTFPNIQQIGAVNKWRNYITGRNVVVAVIDTGVDDSHPNLRGKVIDGFNFTDEYNGDSSIYLDNNGHGTHVAGIIAGAFLPYNGFVGVAPGANLLALKALNSRGTGNLESVINAIDYSINWRGPTGEKVGVINLSLSIQRDNRLLHNAIKRAKQSQIPIVAASGNNGDGNHETKEYQFPGSYSEVIEVGAVNEYNEIAHFTNTNEEIDLFAPGVNIYSTYLNGGIVSLSGTSMAAPHVSGAIALLIEQSCVVLGNAISEKKIFDVLCENTKTLGLGKDIEGCGSLYLKS